MNMKNNVGQFGDTSLTKVFVGGLAWETPQETLRDYFEKYGEILEAVIICDKLTGRSKGYGFVTFKDAEAADKACEDATPIINGRRANCNIASLGARRCPKSASAVPPLKQGSNAGPRATLVAQTNNVQWYYPAGTTPPSFHHQHHQTVPFYGYPPTYVAMNINYNHKLSYNGGTYMNGNFSHVYPAGQALVGANALTPMYPVYPYHQSQTLGYPSSPALATRIFPSSTAWPISNFS